MVPNYDRDVHIAEIYDTHETQTDDVALLRRLVGCLHRTPNALALNVAPRYRASPPARQAWACVNHAIWLGASARPGSEVRCRGRQSTRPRPGGRPRQGLAQIP